MIGPGFAAQSAAPFAARVITGIAAMCTAAGLLAWAAHDRGYQAGVADGKQAGFNAACRSVGGDPLTLMTLAAPMHCLMPRRQP